MAFVLVFCSFCFFTGRKTPTYLLTCFFTHIYIQIIMCVCIMYVLIFCCCKPFLKTAHTEVKTDMKIGSFNDVCSVLSLNYIVYFTRDSQNSV